MSRRTATAAAALAAMLTLTTACGNDDPAPAPTTAEPSATTSKPATPKDQAVDDAEKALDRYFEVTNKMRTDPSIPVKKLETVATSTGLLFAQSEFARYRSEKGITYTGDATYEIDKILEVNLDNSAPDKGRVPTVQFQVCWDLTETDSVNEDGVSQVSPKRLDRSIATYFVSNYDYAKRPHDGWKVSSFQTKMEREC